ncbi:indole-3-acetic acid inducible 24, AUXIN RESPONSE FACTOR 5, MONOPTEROS [Hibiscus trionum]|uniref:Auxin-responsive protein n=1 Tax=Hibiscus trionum TaxID=183268 RepID=A0A9W7J3T6_HIBTR|nr:indole-3-acetic acid inducible 24, AUXIN RESPONSE FACTOR 5, MONOPTEROS [Hibiscus trionum]
MIDPFVSNAILDEFCSLKNADFQNPSDCLVGSFSSCQDVQSKIISTSLADSQAFSRQDLPDSSGGTSRSNIDFDESGLLQTSSWKQMAPRVRTYTKVQKAGSVGRSIDVTSFKNYDELISAIECMFGLKGLLDDPKGSGWKLVYVDYENDVLLVGDDPWEEFVGCVRCI